MSDMGRYDFDVVYDRRGTDSIKWDGGMKYQGRDDLLPLWVADMDFRLPEEVIDDIKAHVDHGIFGYTDPGDRYIDALNSWFGSRHGFGVTMDELTVTPGVVYGISLAIRALTKSGDAVIIQQPVYYPFMRTIKGNCRKVVNSELVYNNGRYEIDFDDFEEKIVSEDVKLFILCSPHNPVGRVWTKEELTRLGDICDAHGVYIFADEIHSDFVYIGFKHTSFITLGEKYTKRLVLGTAPSKTFNLAGLQLANIIIPDEEIRKAVRGVNDANGYEQPNALAMTAMMSAYTKGGPWLDELKDYLAGNLDYVREFLAKELPGVHLVEPEGTYLIWLDFSDITQDYHELENIIVDKAKLWLDPGIIFGKKSALFERINIATPRSILEKAMEQLREGVRIAMKKGEKR